MSVIKKALITGASDGFGLEVAKLLLKEDIEIVSLSRTSPAINGIHHILTDLRKKESIDNAIKYIKTSHSDFDIIIHSAGIFLEDNDRKTDINNLYDLYQVNLLSFVHLLFSLISNIRDNEADVVIIGSTCAYKYVKNQIIYGSSKRALKEFGKNLREMLSDTKSRVISFNPGGFHSKLFQKGTSKKLSENETWMEPKELAILLLQIIKLPKSMEVSEIIINRKQH